MKKQFDQKIISGTILVALFILCVLTITLIHINPGFPHRVPAGSSFLILEPESVEEKVIDDYTGIQRIYTFRLPDVIPPGMQIRFFLRHTYSAFYIEDSSLADKPPESDIPHIGHTPGHLWVSIPTYPSLAGETMHIALTPVYDTVKDDDPVFYFIDRDTLLSGIVFPQDCVMLLLSIISIAAGLFLILFIFTPGLSADNRNKVFCTASVTIFAGVWKLCSLPFLLLLTDYMGIEKEIWYTGVLCYLMMLILSLCLQILLRKDRGNRIAWLCFYIAAAIAGIIILLQIAGVAELQTFLVKYGIIVALLHIISLFGQRPTWLEFLWGFPFFIAIGLDFLICLIVGSLRNAPFFLLWILLNLFIHGFGFLKNEIEKERQLRLREMDLKESRIQAMMSEIRPHFIYNTLTSIYMLCDEDPRRAQNVIGDFTTYLRGNFTAISSTKLVSFEKELTHTRAYVAVESVLYENKLFVEYDIKYTEFSLPPLVLQPIVENAIKHGVGSGKNDGHILVSTEEAEGKAIITVTDDGYGFSENPESPKTPDSISGETKHVGLNNVRKRLELMCGGTLEIISPDKGGTIVTITVPHPDQ